MPEKETMTPEQYKEFWIRKAANMCDVMPEVMALRLRKYMKRHSIGTIRAAQFVYDYYLGAGEYPPDSLNPENFKPILSHVEKQLREDFADLEGESGG